MILHEGLLHTNQNGKDYWIRKERGTQWRYAHLNGGTMYGIASHAITACVRGRVLTINGGVIFALTGEFFDFSCPVEAELMVMFVEGFEGQNVLGVAIEDTGRLKYIDGCTDSLLIYAPRLGDPCLNHLHFPAGIDQTFHNHPSIRMGYVYRGNGVASFPEGDVPLKTGDIFRLEPDTLHRFRTPNESMDIIAFHPSTDVGPTDDSHPMIIGTIIED